LGWQDFRPWKSKAVLFQLSRLFLKKQRRRLSRSHVNAASSESRTMFEKINGFIRHHDIPAVIDKALL